MVLFSKGKYLVVDESKKKFISGVHTLDNCYGLVLNADIVCNNIHLPNEDLWHQWMEHASYKHLSIVSKHESVFGIPKLSKMSKKQNSISLSTAKTEYIAADSCCTQLLWMQKLLHDYGICQEHLTIYCDNTSAINISKNPIQHSGTKHIEIRHHFIRELVEDGSLTLEFISHWWSEGWLVHQTSWQQMFWIPLSKHWCYLHGLISFSPPSSSCICI